jgi:hypothetical protein
MSELTVVNNKKLVFINFLPYLLILQMYYNCTSDDKGQSGKRLFKDEKVLVCGHIFKFQTGNVLQM